MLTINDIIKMLYVGKGCKSCRQCRQKHFCWYDAVKITREYIEREGVI